MKPPFGFRTIVFALLAASVGSTTGVLLASHGTGMAPRAGSVAMRLAGHGVEALASPEPSDSPTAEPTESPEPQPTESPEAEPTEAPEAEPTESPEAEPNEEPTPAPTSGTATTSTRTFTLTGGSVTLSCTGSNPIMVDSVTPNPGFTVEQSREDGDNTVEIRFESSSHESRLQADCMGGQVQQLELEENNS